MPPALRHTAGCPSGQRERSVKPSAQPTLVRTQHLPPPAETALWLRKRVRGPFSSCHAVYRGVSLRVDALRCPRTYSGQRPGRLRGRGHRRLSTDGHGRPRQKGPCPCPGAVPVPCAARRPASPGTGGRGGGKDERCGRPWLLLPGARAGSFCTGEGARPGRLSLNVIHPGRPGGPDPSRTPTLCSVAVHGAAGRRAADRPGYACPARDGH